MTTVLLAPTDFIIMTFSVKQCIQNKRIGKWSADRGIFNSSTLMR